MRTITTINPINQNIIYSKPKHERVAAYARVSTDSDQQQMSFSAQVKHYTDYIKANHSWEFVGVYADSGISGTKKENRTELLRLLEDCENKKIDLVITKSISRFARNTTDCLTLVRRLVELGIAIYFEKENINTLKSDSELMLSVLSSLAAEESVSISQNTKWAIKKKFADGSFKLSSPPYGYSYDGEKLIINEEQAKIVRFMYLEALTGHGVRAIAIKLNEAGIKPQRGQKWTTTTVRGILQNEKYMGDVLLQKTYTNDNFRRLRNDGELEQFYIQDHHEAIVSRNDFEKASKLMHQRGLEKGNNREKEKYQRRYTLSSKIICGECGAKLKRKINNKNKNEKYVAWCCSRHIDTNGRDCSMLFVKEERIHSAFIAMVTKLRLYRNQILKPLLAGLKELEASDCGIEITEINKSMQENSEQIQILTGLLAKGYLEPALFNERNNALQSEIEELKERRSNLMGNTSGNENLIAQTDEFVKFLNKDTEMTVFDNELFLQFVEYIEVFSPTEIGFHLKNGLCLRERIER